MNYNEFINTYLGKGFDYDGVSGIQCVDLAKMYLNKVFGIKPGAWGNAKDYYEKYSSREPLVANFTRIANTASFVPKKGDIVIWGTGLGNAYGHIAIATGEGNTHQFYSYDLNWGSKVVHKVLHNYKGFLGVLRPKDQSKIIESRYKIGQTYTTQVNLYIRKDAGKDKPQVPFNELSENAKKYANPNGSLKAGTKVTCKEAKNIENDIWIRIPSGWIAGFYQGKEYVK